MKQISLLLFALLFVCFTSCNDDDDGDPGAENEVEEITEVVVEFTPTDGGGTLSFSFSENLQEEIVLDANTTYNSSVQFLNTEETPTEDVTEEVLEEDDEHLVCYFISNNSILNVEYDDVDDNGLAVGLQTIVTTGVAGQTGTFNVVLRHQPNLKETLDIINCAVGSIDADIDFAVSIQ